MPSSIQRMPRATRRRLTRTVHRCRDRDPVRRARALLHWHTGHGVSETARLICVARSTVRGWREWYLEIRTGRLGARSAGPRMLDCDRWVGQSNQRVAQRLTE
ncbi:MAG: hypothetical protein GKR94_25810 [Gammaproteobacteria bacterium]|nr:hypothetical protein [Gammaproteobacteria bacterium]